MDTNLVPYQATDLIRLSTVAAELDIGDELDWQPDHLAPSAWHEHIPFAFWLVKALRPRSVVELGSHWGVSYAAFCQAAERIGLSARCYAVDTWDGDPHAGEYGEDVFAAVNGLNERRWRRFSTLLRTTFAEARGYFGPGEVDLLHIDGFHTYDATAGDFHTWRDTLSDRGVVLFHDTNVREREFGVWRLWQELKSQHPHFEFTHGHGLGVLGVGGPFPEPLKALFAASADPARTGAIRSLFAARGEAVRHRYLYDATNRRLAESEARLASLQQEAGTLATEATALREQTLTLQEQSAATAAMVETLRQELSLRPGDQVLRQELDRALAEQLVAASAATVEALRQELSLRPGDEDTREELARALAEQAAAVADRDRIQNDYAMACGARDGALSEAAQARAAAAAAFAQRDALIRSTSWRITRPLRVAVGILRGQPTYRNELRRILGRAPLPLPPGPGGVEPAPAAAPPPPVQGLAQLLSGPDTAEGYVARRVPAPMFGFPDPASPRRLTLVTDSISAGSLFGGVGTAVILSTLLARRLDMPLRVVTRSVPPEARNFATVLRAHGLAYDGSVEFVFSGRDGGGTPLPVGANDLLLTTSWWTTSAARRLVPPERILYLLQEDERMFYPSGDEQLRCQEVMLDEKLRFIINTNALLDHLRSQGMRGVAANGMAFEPAFPKAIYHRAARETKGRRRFFFYARPNHPRNLFLRGLEVVAAAIERGVLREDEWDFHFVGSDLPPIVLPGGIRPHVSQNLAWEDYAALVRSVDVGLSLMNTPHPSYPPLDLAASGAVVVTNSYGPKVSLERYSRNIICTEPSVDALVEGLSRAVVLAKDEPRREANYREGMIGRDWEAAFAPVLDRIAMA
jgi:hypothetical protein